MRINSAVPKSFTKKCDWRDCGKFFETKHRWQKYCNREHMRNETNARRRALDALKRANNPIERELKSYSKEIHACADTERRSEVYGIYGRCNSDVQKVAEIVGLSRATTFGFLMRVQKNYNEEQERLKTARNTELLVQPWRKPTETNYVSYRQ